MHAAIENKMQELTARCLKHHVRTLSLFGSAASEHFDPLQSDMDFIVEFQPMKPGDLADAYFGLLEDLEQLFGCPVDLVTEQSIENPYFRASVNQSRIPLYDAAA